MAFSLLSFSIDRVKNLGFVNKNLDAKQFRLTLASNTGIDAHLIYHSELVKLDKDVRVYIHFNTDTEDMVQLTERINMLTKIGNFIKTSLVD